MQVLPGPPDEPLMSTHLQPSVEPSGRVKLQFDCLGDRAHGIEEVKDAATETAGERVHDVLGRVRPDSHVLERRVGHGGSGRAITTAMNRPGFGGWAFLQALRGKHSGT